MRLSKSLDEMINDFKNKPRLFASGSEFSYSSSDYLILTKIIEIVTKLSYAEVLKKYILKPLGMNDSGCLNEFDIVNNLAESYGFWKTDIKTANVNLSFPLGGIRHIFNS